jgi:hypothetical protein
MMKWCKKKGVNPPKLDTSDRGFTANYGSFVIVYMDPGQKHWDLVDTIIHESVHIYQAAMAYVNEATSGIEAQAYNIAQISTNLLKDFHAMDEERKARLQA